MNVDIFAQQVEAMHGRLNDLYEGAIAYVQPPPELLPVAFMELGTVSEELQVALEELRQQNEELLAAREQVEAECQRYQDLFEFAPNAYLVTDGQGKIWEANRAAAILFNISPEFLVGKPLINFIAGDRRIFRNQLDRLLDRLDDAASIYEWEVRLQPRHNNPIDAAVTVDAVRNKLGSPITLRWLLRDITERKRAEVALKGNDCDPSCDRPVQVYSKGEIISLQPQTLWLVCQGLVKLSTLSENGIEVLLGLAGPSMPFGSALTSLQIYQATAFSKEVKLVSVSLSELTACPRLVQSLLPKINQRLQQTESLLAITGQRRVEDRLRCLLLLLKQEIGQPVAAGTRLSVRLTHEDLANACCTTRVTITRLLTKLQQQKKISFDPKHHIILADRDLG